jgi:hypothetical protein
MHVDLNGNSTKLALAQRLFRLDPALEWNEREKRFIHTSPRFRERADKELPNWESHWNVETNPTQQFDALVEVFCSGKTLTFGRQIKPLTHIKDGIWELKTPDLRIFGWFCKKDHFIAGTMDLAFKVKEHNLYAGYVGEVARFRDQLDLDEPKFVKGDDPNVLVSNYNYP